MLSLLSHDDAKFLFKKKEELEVPTISPPLTYELRRWSCKVSIEPKPLHFEKVAKHEFLK